MLEHLSDSSSILRKVGREKIPEIIRIADLFSFDDFYQVKEFERINNHDVKSVELFVAEKLEEIGVPELKSYVHLGCTSEDITNPAYARMIRDALDLMWVPQAEMVIDCLAVLAKQYKSTSMLAHTHGQPATPTTVGKEMLVYVYRLRRILSRIKILKTFGNFIFYHLLCKLIIVIAIPEDAIIIRKDTYNLIINILIMKFLDE